MAIVPSIEAMVLPIDTRAKEGGFVLPGKRAGVDRESRLLRSAAGTAV
jgi:hypothetical protein